LLAELNASSKEKVIEVITPSDPNQRGCQVSMLMLKDGKKIFQQLTSNGVIADWREPNVIRIAPVPLYSSFEDVYRFVMLLKACC
jgi:kynureninase